MTRSHYYALGTNTAYTYLCPLCSASSAIRLCNYVINHKVSV
jgi:hypothetical protein